jgi:putative thioredoxin
MEATEQTFDRDVVERSRTVPVVVDFWAEWCAPCRTLGPVIERAVAARSGAVELVKVDVDANPELARRFAVRSIPAVKAFRNGQVVKEFVGALSPPAVESFLDDLAGPPASAQLLDELQETGEFPEILGPLAEGDYERAFEWLLDEVHEADTTRRERIREVMVALFGELGPEHPLTMRFRRRLATALY